MEEEQFRKYVECMMSMGTDYLCGFGLSKEMFIHNMRYVMKAIDTESSCEVKPTVKKSLTSRKKKAGKK